MIYQTRLPLFYSMLPSTSSFTRICLGLSYLFTSSLLSAELPRPHSRLPPHWHSRTLNSPLYSFACSSHPPPRHSSCGKEPLLASVSPNDFSGSHIGFEQEAEHERLPLSKKVRIQQSSKDGVYEKLSAWFQLAMIQLSIRVALYLFYTHKEHHAAKN